MPHEPLDVALDDVRGLRPASGPRAPEAGDDPGTRLRPAGNPVLALKADNRNLRTRLTAAAREADSAHRLQAQRIREVEALASSLEARLASREERIRDLLGSA